MKPIYAVTILIAFGVGVFLGYLVRPKPIWDIGRDKRGCIIQWDDGTIDIKSPIVNLGTLKSGESKSIGNHAYKVEEPKDIKVYDNKFYNEIPNPIMIWEKLVSKSIFMQMWERGLNKL